ncbi:hypothetical protein MJO29_006591 [Puccinia striiformis f. sp. tritici]|nr:hypothetical protein MJO29_006591 [Puccinia striiformis f. sp. tritici]KAI9629383.1 hypothetical protein KEM48_013049 [Puccinia striiformis f. sp. tritici PST-130]
MTSFKVLATLAWLISSKKGRLGLLVATWFLWHQSYFGLSLVPIGEKMCYRMKEIITPTGLEPMEDFCTASLIWSGTLVGLAMVVYIFSRAWTYLKEEFRSFWIELQE